jgi:hypothetical protein
VTLWQKRKLQKKLQSVNQLRERKLQKKLLRERPLNVERSSHAVKQKILVREFEMILPPCPASIYGALSQRDYFFSFLTLSTWVKNAQN